MVSEVVLEEEEKEKPEAEQKTELEEITEPNPLAPSPAEQELLGEKNASEKAKKARGMMH